MILFYVVFVRDQDQIKVGYQIFVVFTQMSPLLALLENGNLGPSYVGVKIIDIIQFSRFILNAIIKSLLSAL